MEGNGKLSLKGVAFIAGSDLLSEKLMTACLVLCVLAVLSPLLLILSVKVGFIDRLRSDFIEDPSFREIRPATADLRQSQSIEELKRLPGAAFVVPSVMLVPREVDLVFERDGKQMFDAARLWPSDASDPLYAKLEGEPPSGDNVVLTKDLADDIGAGIGSEFRIQASRVESDVRKRVEIIVKVAGLIPASLLPQPTMLAAPVLDRQIEDFRSGVAVPERNWAGFKSVPAQSYTQLAFIMDEPPGEILASNLKIRLGVPGLEPSDEQAIVKATGSTLGQAGAGRKVFIANRPGRPFSASDIREAMDVFKNAKAAIFGINPPLEMEIAGKRMRLVGADRRFMSLPQGLEPDWMIRPDARLSLNDAVWLPAALRAGGDAAGTNLAAKVIFPGAWTTKEMTIPLRLGGFVDGDVAYGSASLLAMIYRGEKLPIAYDSAAHSFVERSSGYRGFRMVATDIDSVPALVAALQDKGIAVKARSDEISKLQQLERSLDLLILVVGLVGVCGGLAILASSFFANVQRKRVDYANLRLIGMQKRHVFQIPVVQALIVAVLGLAASIAAYLAVAWILNTLVASQLGFEGQLSKLHVRHYAILAVSVLVGAMLSALAASREATRIDPAQALRSGG